MYNLFQLSYKNNVGGLSFAYTLYEIDYLSQTKTSVRFVVHHLNEALLVFNCSN